MEMTISHRHPSHHQYSSSNSSSNIPSNSRLLGTSTGLMYNSNNTSSSSYPTSNNGNVNGNVKYEPIDSIGSVDSQHDFISNAQTHQLLDSPKSFFDHEFFDSPESLSSARMNGVIQSVSQGAGVDPCALAKMPQSSHSSDDQSHHSDDYSYSNGTSKNGQKASIRGRASNLDRKRPYPCKVCPSKFGSKMELEEHQNSHTGQKPFECEVCNSRFNRRSTLWNHKRIHSDAKPFQCSVCHMQFKWKNSLKCHKEMHVRKNETTVAVDNEIRQLTYATAAKKRLLEMEGGDRTVSSITIFSAASTSSDDSSSQKNQLARSASGSYQSSNAGRRRLSKVKKESQDEEDLLAEATVRQNLQQQQQQQQQLLENSLLNNVNSLSMDMGIDMNHHNFDLNSQHQLLMQAICNGDMDPGFNQSDLRTGNQQNCSIFGVDDHSKMISNSILDIKDSLSLHSPIGNSINMFPLFKSPVINVNVNVDFNNLNDCNNRHQLPTINHFTSSSSSSNGNTNLNGFISPNQDAVTINSHFHLNGNSVTSTSSSSASSSLSNSHHGHVSARDINNYQSSLDHSLLLNTNQHNNMDYMQHNFDYMRTNYPNGDVPLSALNGCNDNMDHSLISPHSGARMMLYHGIEQHHHPNCMNGQMPASQLR